MKAAFTRIAGLALLGVVVSGGAVAAQGLYKSPPAGANCSAYDYLNGGYWCDGPGTRRAQPAGPPPGAKTFDSTLGEMKSKNNYCGTDGTNWYFCPKNKSCDPSRLGKCVAKPAVAKPATPEPPIAQQAASAAGRIKAEQVKAASAAATAGNASVAQRAVAAGIIATIERFAEFAGKAQAALPQEPSAGFKGWVRGDERKGETPDGRGYATDYVRAIWEKVTGKPLPADLGEAGEWYEAAKAKGLKTAPAEAIDKVPPGAIAVWDDSEDGHVAVVISNSGTELVVTEANFGRFATGASKFERDNAITASFNKHEERTLAYAGARERGKYKLLGFILPE